MPMVELLTTMFTVFTHSLYGNVVVSGGLFWASPSTSCFELLRTEADVLRHVGKWTATGLATLWRLHCEVKWQAPGWSMGTAPRSHLPRPLAVISNTQLGDIWRDTRLTRALTVIQGTV